MLVSPSFACGASLLQSRPKCIFTHLWRQVWKSCCRRLAIELMCGWKSGKTMAHTHTAKKHKIFISFCGLVPTFSYFVLMMNRGSICTSLEYCVQAFSEGFLCCWMCACVLQKETKERWEKPILGGGPWELLLYIKLELSACLSQKIKHFLHLKVNFNFPKREGGGGTGGEIFSAVTAQSVAT